MKKLIIIITGLIVCSCKMETEEAKKERKFTVYSFDQPAQEWSSSSISKIECDSSTMIDHKTANVWIDGIKFCVVAKHHVTIESN